MKNRSIIFTKAKYTKQEVIDIVGEIIEESKVNSFNNWDEVYLNEKDFVESKDYVVEYSKDTPEIEYVSIPMVRT